MEPDNDNNMNNSQLHFVSEFYIHVNKYEVVTSPNPPLTTGTGDAAGLRYISLGP